MKRLLFIFVVAACVWLLLFQGTSISPDEEAQSQKVPNVVLAIDGEIIMLRFLVFVVILAILGRLLHWHVYDRSQIHSGRI